MQTQSVAVLSPRAWAMRRQALSIRGLLLQVLPMLVLLLLVLLLPGLAAAQVRISSEYLQRMDTDRDGRVSLPEYHAWMGYGFDRMDRNGDGVLVAAELPGGRGPPVSRVMHRQWLAAAFRRQDRNGDGHLDANELAAPAQ